MHKKHIFLRVFQKIAIFACVFCAVPAWSETTCDIDFTPVTGNSWQNGTPTPTTPVEIESIGTKVGNKYQIPVVAQGKNLWSLGDFTPNTLTSRTLEGLDPNKTYTISMLASNDFTTTSPDTWSVSPRNADGTSRGNVLYMRDYVAGQIVSTQFSGASMLRVQVVGITGSLFPMLTEGSVAPASYAPYSAPITTPIYLNAPLRKVGDYADVLDYKNGTITRNVGVKVLDGTENWIARSGNTNIELDGVKIARMLSDISFGYCSHMPVMSNGASWSKYSNMMSHSTASYHIVVRYKDAIGTIEEWKTFLADQYAAGTPVTIYYPLATPVVEQIENWSCPVPITDIKIATTKMVDEEFAQAEANLAATVQTIESVVSRTIDQTEQIQILQDTKQTRPDENCPANMKCLLVQDEDGTPHWYPIIEP